MPKLAAKPSEDEANAPTEVRERPSVRRLSADDLAEAANFAEVVVQSVMARRVSRPASGVVPSNRTRPVQVPAAPRLPSLVDSRPGPPRDLVAYAVVAGAVVGAAAWFAFRYL